MANINSVITYNANLSPAQAQIKALTSQVAGLTAAFNSLDASALKAQRSLSGTFAANVGQIGGFTAQTVKATSSVENFGRQLAANKLTMREYFREAITGYTRQNSLMRQLAEQQVRYQQSIAVPTGGGQAMMLTPQAINASSSAAQLASQRFSIFNQLVNGGATAMLNWGKNTQWAGRQLMVGFTLPLALFAGAMSKQFRELDKELTRFQKVYGSDLGNAVSESTKRMRDQVQQLAYDISATYGIAAKETAALAADIAATGAEGEKLMSSVEQTTRLAVLGEVDRQEAMKATLSLQSAFRLNTNELAESINFLNAVENQTSATLEDLSTAIPKVGPVIRSLGGDVKDLATLLVAMREGGIPAAEAANALKSGLASLINPTKQASEVAKQFGVDLVGIVEANRGQLMPTIYAMQEALGGLDSFSRSRIIEQIFGKYQFARISALFDNIGRVGSQTQSVIELASKSSAELAAVANGEIRTLTESTAVKFQRTLEQLKNSLMPIAQTLTETLIPVLEKVGEGVKMFSTFFSSLPDGVKSLAKWGVAFTALAGPVIMLVGLFGNLVANGLKFGMMIVRLGAKMAGIKTEKFQLLDEHVMAAKLGVDNLTNAFTTQEIAMKRLVGVLSQYEQSLGRLAVREPALFIPGAIPGARGAAPIRRQKGSTAPEKVPGGYGGGDRIPALLEPGESVVTKEATAKFWPVIEAMNRGNLPGFNRGVIFLGMPRGYKDIQQAKQVRQTLSNTNVEATTGRFATLPVTDIGKKVTSIGGRSSSIPGVNGIYEEGGKKYVVKTHDTADSALAEVRGTQLTRDIFGLDTPIQELIKIKHPVTGDVIFAVRSPYETKFASSTGVIDEKNFFGQALAAIIRRDKDLQPDNLYGNIVTDVGQAFVANKASQPRTIGGAMPSVAEQTETNFLMSKGGARKWFAESTAAMAKKMPEDEYVKGFQTTIAEAARKARRAIDNLPYMTKEERMMYGRIIDDLDEAAKIDWRAVYQFHRGITPEVKRPPTAAALAKKEAQEAEKARQRGDMARWEYGLPYRFQKGGEVPGGYGGGDKVPAFLEPGEFVITKEATKLNKSFLEAINSGKTPGMYKTGRDSAGGSGQADVGRAAKLHTVPPDELAKMYYGPGSKSMLGVLGYGGLTTTLHPQYINNTFDKLTGIPSWMKAGIPFNDRAAAQMLSVLIKERDQRGGKVGPEFTRSIQYLQKLIKTPGKARSITLNGYAATTAAAERLAGIIPDTDKAQKARAQQLAAELNRRVGTTTSPGRIFSTINRLSMEYIDKAIADPKMRSLIWESTPGTSKTKFKDSLRERLPRFAQSGFLFRGIRLGRFQKGGVGTGEPALLEPGEFVVNSDASAQYAPILRAMNRGTIGKYQNGRDDVAMRPGYNPNDPKYSSPDKTPTGGQHQGHIFGAPVAPGIPAFGKNLQIGGQAIFWHQDFWKMVTAAENQLANVLAMSAGNRARFMESLSTVGPQFNASQQQIDRIMLAVTNGFMQHEDDVTLYQAALRNLGQRISTGAASVTGSMAGLIKQVESIKITGYSAAEAKAVETRLITEYQRILSTPGKLAETARIAIAKQLQLVQQQMTATGIATTQMTSSLAASIQASAARPFPSGVLAPVGSSPLAAATAAARTTGPSVQLSAAEQNLIKAIQLRESIVRRVAASEGLIENMNSERLRILNDTKLTEEKRRAILQQITSDLAIEEANRDRLREAEQRADRNVIAAKERAARAWGTTATNATAAMTRPGGIYGPGGYDVFGTVGKPAAQTPDWLRTRMDQAARMGPGVPTGIIPAIGVMSTGPAASMQDPMAKAMRGQALMNVAFMGSMAVGSLGALGVASEDAASKLMLLSTALMALPMLQMISPRGMATNFLGLGGLGQRMQAAGMARAAAAGGGISSNIATRGLNAGPGAGLFGAGARIGALGGPKGIALAMGITAIVAAYMLYKKAADEARERAIASFEDPAKSAEYFGETIDDLTKELENRAGRFKVGEFVDIDPELRKIVGEEYAPLIERLKYSQAEDGARQLSLAYNNMLINGLSAENAQATLKAIAAEAGTQGGIAYSEAFRKSMINSENTEEAIQKQLDLLNPENNKDLIERLQGQIPQLETTASDVANQDALSRWKMLATGIVNITKISVPQLSMARMLFSGDPQKEGQEIAGEFFRGFGEVWTSFTGQLFDSTPEAAAADAAQNAVDQTKTSIEELKQLSADAFAASTEDFMKAYEDAPQKVIEAIRMSSQWIDASTENVDILKQKLMELSPVLAGLIATLENPEEIALFYQLLTVGADPTRFFNEDGFNTGYAQQTVDTIVYYDELEKKNNETFTSMKEDTIDFIDNQIKETNKGIRKINDYWDSWAKITRKEQRQAEKDYDQAQRRSEKFIDGKQDEIEAIEDAIDARREEFDEKMQDLQDEKDLINESTDKYIESLNKRKEADSFYAQQRKTSLGALQKLASGDVFGFLQDRQQMSADAQTFSYDQMISDIEDRRDLEVDAIDETMEKERRRQEEWEKAQRDKIDGINDLIDAERDLMEERTKAHEKDLRQFEKRQKTIETNRKQDLKGERTKLADLTKAREKAESLELADYEEMSTLLGKEYEDRYGKQILELQKAQYYIRLNALLEQNLSLPVDKRRKEEELMVDAFTSAFGQRPGPAQGGSLAQGIIETLRDMGMFPYGPGQGGQPLASGGKVTGPGGPKSDVIPAMLSNGEYVVQASSVKKYGTDLMNTINAGKFASGGLVQGFSGGGTADRQEGYSYTKPKTTKPKTTYTYTPGATNPISVYSSPTKITGYPPNLTSYFDTNRRYQNKNTPDNNYKAHGIYSGKSYVPYAQDALDARSLPDGYSGGKKWRENMSRLTNLGLNSSEFFNQWRNLRRWEKEQFIRSLENVSINQPPPTVIERGLPGKLVVPEDRGPIDSYSVPWWLSQPQSFLPPESKPYPVYPGRPESGDTGNWPQRQNAGTALVNWIKALFGGDGPKIEYWNDPYRGWVPRPTGYANGGIVGFRNGSSNPTWYSADRAEQAATGTRGQPNKPYYGSTTTYTSPYTYTPGWSPTLYRLPAQRYGPYGVGRIPRTRKPYTRPEFGRTADLSAILASNYSHKLGAYATTSQHLAYLRQKAGASYVPGYGYIGGSSGGDKWQSITSLLSSPFGTEARSRLTGAARDLPTIDYWRTLSREQKAWFLEYATTGNTNNWSNSRIFKLMPWLPKETRRVIERGLPGKLRVPMDRGVPTALNAYPNTVTIGQNGVAPTAPGSTNYAPYGFIPGTNIPVPRPPGAPATSGYPMGWDITTRVPMDRPAKPSGSNYIWDPQRYMWVSIESVGAGTSWGWPWYGNGIRDNAQSPIRFRPGMTPDTTRTSPQERYPIGMSGIYLGTSTWLGRTLDKFSLGQSLSPEEKSSLNSLYERSSPEEKKILISEIYRRAMPSRESISFRSLNEMSSIQRGASLRTLGNETGYELDLIRRGNGGPVQKFAEGGPVELQKTLSKWIPNNKLSFYSNWDQFGTWPGGKPSGVMMHHTAGVGSGVLEWMARHPEAGKPVVQAMVGRNAMAHVLAYGGTGWGAGEGSTAQLKDPKYKGLADDLNRLGGASNTLWQVEVESEGLKQDFTSGMFDTIARMTAAIREYSGWNTFRGRIINHRDWAPGRKPDTLYPVSVFERNAEKVWGEGSGSTETTPGNNNQNRRGRVARQEETPNVGDSLQSSGGFGKAIARILGRQIIPTGRSDGGNGGGGGTPGGGSITLDPNDYKNKFIKGYDLVKLIYGTGWKNKDDVRTAYGIVMGESGGDRTGKNYNAGGAAPGSTDWGLWQINDFYHKTAGDDKEKVDFGPRIMDAIYNSRIAYKIAKSRENAQAFDGDQWGSWNAYRDKTTQYNLGLQTFDNNPNWWRQLVTQTGGSNNGGGGDNGGSPGTVPAARAAVNFIRAQVGDRYVTGAGGPDSWDCSNLTAAAWNHAAEKQVLSVPSSVQANQISKRVVGLKSGKISGVIPGDVLYFAPNGVGVLPGHTSMYVGNGNVVEASSPATGVRVSSLNNAWNTGVGKFKWAGPPKNLRSGGFISGPGGPRSDSIPAMLSNGEYVVKASSVAKYGKGFMDKLNNGSLNLGGGDPVLQFADGGMVGNTQMPAYNLPQVSSPSFGLTNNNFGGNSSASSNRTNVKVIINGANGKSANAIANRVVSMINDANRRREHSRSV